MVLFGNSGADFIDMDTSTSPQTIVGGDDSNDGADAILSGSGSGLDLW